MTLTLTSSPALRHDSQMLQAGAKANSSSFEAREERYLDRRERAGLCRVSRMVVEGTIYDVN